MITSQKILWGMFGLLIAVLPAYLYARIAGPDPRFTAAPGDNPLACSSATCHTGSPRGGPINAAGGAVTATFSGCSYYTPGVPQTITVSVTDPVNVHYGFQMTARFGSSQAELAKNQAGDFTPGANQIVICDAPFGAVKGPNGCPANQQVQFIEHSFCITCPASTSPYTFTWTPPANNVGDIRFYVAGNAVNNNIMADALDHVYTNTYVLTPAQAETPAVVDGGVLNSASFAKDANGLGSAVAPGSLVSIFGTYQGAAQADAAGVPFPSCLGGVGVTFNGVVARLLNVVPTGPFINAQIPFEVAPGTANVVVTVHGAPSAPKPITVVAAAPGVFTIPPDGQHNAVLVFIDPADGQAKIAAPASASDSIGYLTAPVPRGQPAFFYATGLGVMTPSVADGNGGDEAPVVAHIAVKPTVLIGNIPAQVDFAGQAPGYPGVNQVNIVIPPTAPLGNSVPLQVRTADGSVISTSGATIAIR